MTGAGALVAIPLTDLPCVGLESREVIRVHLAAVFDPNSRQLLCHHVSDLVLLNRMMHMSVADRFR